MDEQLERHKQRMEQHRKEEERQEKELERYYHDVRASEAKFDRRGYNNLVSWYQNRYPGQLERDLQTGSRSTRKNMNALMSLYGTRFPELTRNVLAGYPSYRSRSRRRSRHKKHRSRKKKDRSFLR